jgi:hypothetical protein
VVSRSREMAGPVVSHACGSRADVYPSIALGGDRACDVIETWLGDPERPVTAPGSGVA